MIELEQLTQAIVRGDRRSAADLVRRGLEGGMDPRPLLDAMVAGMDEIGGRFKRNEVFVPEMLIASRAMKEAIALLEPRLAAGGYRPVATAVLGTVQGDLHDIGKNLVAMMWKGANIAVVDLGTNVPPERFVEAARAHHARFVGLSALLTTTMPAMKATVQAVKSAGLAGVQVVVGGAPITADFARQIGADGFAPDAASAVDLLRGLMGDATASGGATEAS